MRWRPACEQEILILASTETKLADEVYVSRIVVDYYQSRPCWCAKCSNFVGERKRLLREDEHVETVPYYESNFLQSAN
jgi:hypothetical protein